MQSFRIATYNIHKGRGLDWRVRIERISTGAPGSEADIVTLQEVINHQHRSPEEHQASYLAEQLGYFYSVGETRKHRNAAYGNVTLSRWEFETERHIDLSVIGREPRGALRTDIRVGHELLHIYNVHLGTAVGERDEQARLIDERLLKSLGCPRPPHRNGRFQRVESRYGDENFDERVSLHRSGRASTAQTRISGPIAAGTS